MPSRNCTGQTPAGSLQRQLAPTGGEKKLYYEAVHTSTDKLFQLMLKYKVNLPTEAVKTVVKTNTNPTAMKVGSSHSSY